MCDSPAGRIEQDAQGTFFRTLTAETSFIVTCLLTSLQYRTLFVSASGLEHAKQVVTSYKKGEVRDMTPELWKAKKIIDSTLHPGMVVEHADQIQC